MTMVLTAEESAKRIAELKAQGYDVYTETLPDGSIAVYRRDPGAGWGWLILLLIGIGGCALSTRRR